MADNNYMSFNQPEQYPSMSNSNIQAGNANMYGGNQNMYTPFQPGVQMPQAANYLNQPRPSFNMTDGGFTSNQIQPGSFQSNAQQPWYESQANMDRFGSDNVAGEPTFWDKMWGTKETGPGRLGTAVGLGVGAAQVGLGFANYELGKDQLKTNKRQFSQQFEAQKKQVNQDIYDKSIRMSRINPKDYPSAENYYERNKLA